MKLDLPEGREFNFSPAVLAGVVGVILLVTGIFTSVYQVNTDSNAVVLRFGKFQAVQPPGLHFKLPYGIDEVIQVPVLRLDVEEFGLAQPVTRRGQQEPEENLMLTGDLNLVRAGLRVQYTRSDPRAYLFNVRDPEVTLRDIAQSVMREVMGDNASIYALTAGRAAIQQDLRDRIQILTDEFDMGISINEVNLMFVDPPEEVRPAFEDLNKAEQDATRFFEEASREYQSRIPEARGVAERTILEAQGYRQERINRATGEANRFETMLQQYVLAPEVTRTRLFLETVEERYPLLQRVIVIDEKAKGILPLLNLGEEKR